MQRAENDRRETHKHRNARTKNQAAPHVSSELIGTQPVRAGGWLQDQIGALRKRIVWCDRACEDREQCGAQDDEQADRSERAATRGIQH
jgi:hypothetical protein